jgi:hypothetical protein
MASRLPKSAMIGPLLSVSSPTQTKFAASAVAPDPHIGCMQTAFNAA